MKAITAEVLEYIARSRHGLFISRHEPLYDPLLQLYEGVGYAPNDKSERSAWRDRSRSTWRRQDARSPRSCSIAFDGELPVSSWGTLLMTPTVLYGHSVCMVKTLCAAATLYAQALNSLDILEDRPDIQFWAGSYAYRSKFTALFQRPIAGCIPDQIELEVHRIPPQISNDRGAMIRLVEGASACAQVPLPIDVEQVFELLSRSHGIFGDGHLTCQMAICDRSSGRPLGRAIRQIAWPEFTGANVFGWTWVFPATGIAVDKAFAEAVSGSRDLGGSHLQLVVDRVVFKDLDLGCPTIPSFWAFTRREYLPFLRISFRAAFAGLLDQYREDELEKFTEGKCRP
jgi:hypothetical protein